MANSTTTLTALTFNPSKLTLEAPEEVKGRKGSWSAKLKYDDDYFLVQTAKLFTPFGANSFNNDGKFALTFTVDGKDEKQAALQKMLVAFENRVKELVQDLKSKKLSKLNFSPLVKESSDPEKYNPTFTVKLRTVPEKNFDGKDNDNVGDLYATVYNKSKTKVAVNVENIEQELGRRSSSRCLLMMNKVWFASSLGKFGVTVNAKQLMVYPNKEQGCMFNEVSDDESEEEVAEETEEADEELDDLASDEE